MLLGLSPRRPEWHKLELLSEIGFICWMTYLFSFCLSWNIVFACLLISHFLAGILHIQITLSHFTMDLIEGNQIYGIDKPEENFLEVQLKTT
jgi:delta8-fatty-acid desaturase